jgi:hypothetical protein
MKPLTLLLCLAACGGGTSVDIAFPVELLPSAPAELSNYAVREPIADDGSLEDRARCVFESNPVCEVARQLWPERYAADDENIWSAGGCELRRANATGGESLVDLTRFAIPPAVSAPLLEDDAAQSIADAYLSRWLPESAGELGPPSVREMAVASSEADEEGLPVGDPMTDVAGYRLSYQRLLDGLPVDGPGGFVRVYLDATGSPVGHAHVWRDVDRLPAAPLAAPSQVRERFLERHAKSGAEKIEVQSMRLVYLAEGRWTAQREIGPAYLVAFKYSSWSKRVIEVWDARTATPRE